MARGCGSHIFNGNVTDAAQYSKPVIHALTNTLHGQWRFAPETHACAKSPPPCYPTEHVPKYSIITSIAYLSDDKFSSCLHMGHYVACISPPGGRELISRALVCFCRFCLFLKRASTGPCFYYVPIYAVRNTHGQ